MSPDELSPGTDIREYSDFGTEIDLVVEGGRPARHIEVVDDGEGTTLLAIETAESRGTTRMLTVATGWSRWLQVTKIKTTTTVARVQVMW